LESFSNETSRDTFIPSSPLLSPFLTVRTPGSEGSKSVQNYIINVFKELKWDIFLDSFSDSTPIGIESFTNIIVTKDSRASKKIVLAAHYDSKYFKDFEFIGATDSAVSCAILIDLAHSIEKAYKLYMKQFNKNPSITLQIIFFDGEEAYHHWSATDSLYGSRHLASMWANQIATMTDSNSNSDKNPQSVLSSINLFILLDLLGGKNPTIYNTVPETSWAFQRFIDIESKLSYEELLPSIIHQLSLTKGKSQHYGGNIDNDIDNDNENLRDRYFISGFSIQNLNMIDDDHRPFKDRGVPVVHLIPQPFPDFWHTPKDNADVIVPEIVADFALILKVFVIEYLQMDLSFDLYCKECRDNHEKLEL